MNCCLDLANFGGGFFEQACSDGGWIFASAEPTPPSSSGHELIMVES